MKEEDDISKLLRLKRFEQPPPEYFDNFLRDFQDRQRAQLLREPVWRIAWDRLTAFFGEQMPVRLGYGFASAMVLVAAGITSMNILESRPLALTAAREQVRPAAVVQPAIVAKTIALAAPMNVSSQLQLPGLPSLDSAAHTAFAAPRYVMDARPVSYEPSTSF